MSKKLTPFESQRDTHLTVKGEALILIMRLRHQMKQLSPEDRAELARYIHDVLVKLKHAA